MGLVRWGLIGCGDIARKSVVPAIQNAVNSTLVSVNRADSSKAENFAREFGVEKWRSKWQELIIDEEINSVYVATPVYLHADPTATGRSNRVTATCTSP